MIWTPTRIALAIASLLCVLLSAALWVQTARHGNASGELARANAARDAAVVSSGNWQTLSDDINNRLTACNADRAADRERDESAVAAAQAAKREADAVLDAWLDRYAAATASAECLAVERTPICGVPR